MENKLKSIQKRHVKANQYYISNKYKLTWKSEELLTVNIKNPTTDGKFKISFYFTEVSPSVNYLQKNTIKSLTALSSF